MPLLVPFHHTEIVSKIIQNGLLNDFFLLLRQAIPNDVQNQRTRRRRQLRSLLEIIYKLRIQRLIVLNTVGADYSYFPHIKM